MYLITLMARTTGGSGYYVGIDDAPKTAAEHATYMGSRANTYSDPGFLMGTEGEAAAAPPAPPTESFGTVTVTNTNNLTDIKVAIPFLASFDGNFTGAAQYAWTVELNAGGATTGVTISDPTAAATDITFAVGEVYQITCTVTDVGGVVAQAQGALMITVA